MTPAEIIKMIADIRTDDLHILAGPGWIIHIDSRPMDMGPMKSYYGIPVTLDSRMPYMGAAFIRDGQIVAVSNLSNGK